MFYWSSTNSMIESCYWDLMGSSTRARHKLNLSSSTNSDFPNLNFGPCSCICLGFLFSQLSTYIRLILKAVRRGYKDQEFNFLCEKLLRLYTIGFCNQVLPYLHCLWSEELCSQQQSFKLMELVTYWDTCKGVSYRLEICASKERRLLQDQVQFGIGVKVQL